MPALSACLPAQIAAQWAELGLAAPCDVGDNGMHGSASPFEALAERMNWLVSGQIRKISTDQYGPPHTTCWHVTPSIAIGRTIQRSAYG